MSSIPTQMSSDQSSTFDTNLNSELLKAMQSDSHHNQLVGALRTAETEMKNFESKQEEKKDSPSFKAQPSAARKKTFIQQAEQDHKTLRDYVAGVSFYQESRGGVVTLIKRALDEAKVQGYDDQLYETYVHIRSFVRHWYYEEPFFSTVNNTLNAIRQDRLARQLSDKGRLSAENTRLREVNTRLQQSEQLMRKTYEIQKKVAEDKSAMIQQKDKVIVMLVDKYSKVEAKLNELNEKCNRTINNLNKASDRIEKLLKENTDLREENEMLKTNRDQPRKNRSSSPPRGGYNPHFIGGRAARSEEKAYAGSSPKKPGSGTGYYTSPTSTAQ